MSLRFPSLVRLANAMVFPLAAATALTLGACSALVDPDVRGLPPVGGDTDGGRVDGGRVDGGGPVIDVDLGMRDGGGPIDVDLGPPAGCTGAPRCADGSLIECVAGRERRTPCDLGCAPGGVARCAEFVPSNVPPDLLRSGTEDLDVDRDASFDTDRCGADGLATHIVPQSGGPELCVIAVRNLRVRGGSTLGVFGSRPLVVLASADIDIEGTIDVSAERGRPGPGGGLGGLGTMLNGEGIANGNGGEHIDTFDDGGGGGGALCGSGGSGGQGGTAAGGSGGGAISTELAPLLGGSGGGRGRGTALPSGSLAGFGGAGGGSLQLSAVGTLSVSGELLAGGGGGGAGLVSASGAINWGSGGGGGSGGAVLLEAANVDIGGGARIVTAGGGGGGGAAAGRSGGDGSDGTGAPASVGGGGGGGPTDTSGGDGALDGVDGADGASDSSPSTNGGGGGGGSGCIVVRTADGTSPAGAAASTPTGAFSALPVLRR